MTYLAFMSLQIIYSHATQPCAWINNCDGVDWCPTDACTQWVIALFKESHTSISDEQYNIEIKVKSVFLTPHGIVLVLCPFHYFFICCKSLKLLKSNCDISTLIKAHVASCPFSVDTRGIVILLPPYPRSILIGCLSHSFHHLPSIGKRPRKLTGASDRHVRPHCLYCTFALSA